MPSHRRHHSPIVRLAKLVWRSLNWVRTAVLNVFTLIILIAVLLAIFGSRGPELPEQAPLLVSPSGILVDQLSYTSPSARLLSFGNEGPAETVVWELVDTIDRAAQDSRVSALLLQLDNLQGGGLSKLQEVGQALERFRAQGKPIIALADSYSQEQYFLASYADEIHMNELGALFLTGFGLYRNYYKDVLDKLAVNFHIFKVGDYKDFVEPYVRNEMSSASREHNRQWLEALWQEYTEQVEKQRQLEPGTLTRFINDMSEHLLATQGDTAQLAVQHGLVDRASSRRELTQALIERFGAAPDNPEKPLYMELADYKGKRVWPPVEKQSGNIALIVASGTIMDGHHPEGSIGSESLSELIRQVRQDESLQALVLRIDSGGGSAFASEVIRQELEQVREAGKTVVVSMGSLAASGGYWMAMGADEVWATPTTLTGSIGVFGLFPTLEQSLEKLGIHTDGIGTTDLAGAMRVDKSMPEEAVQVMQLSVEHIYNRFLRVVAKNRESDPSEIHKVAQGRVWTGLAAHELGLVDKIGYLNDAIASAAQRAGLEDYSVKLIERELTPQEQLVRELFGADADALWQSKITQWLGLDKGLLAQISSNLPEPLALLLREKIHTTYALCLECSAFK